MNTPIINPEQEKKIKGIPYLKNNWIYNNLDINQTILFFANRFVNPLKQVINISETSAIDCGCGYGWFGFAFILSGGKHITLADPDNERLNSSKRIADILNIQDSSINYVNSSIEKLNYNSNAFDLFVSIGTLEHIGEHNVPPALAKINDIAAKAVLITTPNKFFPVMDHDTRIPCLHWLPIKYRESISKLFGKTTAEHCYFLSPFSFDIFKNKFRNVSKCLSFIEFNDFLKHYPVYRPYGINENLRHQASPSALKKIFYFMTSRTLGVNSYYFMPSLSTIFVKKT